LEKANFVITRNSDTGRFAASSCGKTRQVFVSNYQATGDQFAYQGPQMPARTFPNKSEPIPFACPSCGAKYIIVTVQVPKDGQHNKFGCVKCDALFPVGEGRVPLEYVLVQQPAADVRS
jgi:transposase-like protein